VIIVGPFSDLAAHGNKFIAQTTHIAIAAITQSADRACPCIRFSSIITRIVAGIVMAHLIFTRPTNVDMIMRKYGWPHVHARAVIKNGQAYNIRIWIFLPVITRWLIVYNLFPALHSKMADKFASSKNTRQHADRPTVENLIIKNPGTLSHSLSLPWKSSIRWKIALDGFLPRDLDGLHLHHQLKKHHI
jgi:hypothetical protein